MAGHRTAGRPDPDVGTERGGHPMVNTDWRRTAWPARRHSRPGQRRPTAGTPSTGSTGQTPDAAGRSATRTAQQEGLRREGRPPPWPDSGRVTPPKVRLGALLSSDDFRVERRANGEASSVMTSAQTDAGWFGTWQRSSRSWAVDRLGWSWCGGAGLVASSQLSWSYGRDRQTLGSAVPGSTSTSPATVADQVAAAA